MELGELVGRLGTAILGVEDVHLLLQETTEQIATSAAADYVSLQVEQNGSRWDYRWDRTGGVPATFALRPAARLSSGGPRSEIITAGLAEAQLKCAVLVPVQLSRDEALVLCVGFGAPGRVLPAADVRNIEAIASVLALGISRNTFQQLAVSDPWTRLYNRRWLELAIPSELERLRRYRQPLSVLAVDIDHFKTVNDRYGHVAGDKVLLGIARVLQESIRSCDAAVRLGGDEFLLVLPETSYAGVVRIARRVEERVRSLSFGDARTPVRITVSGGAAFAGGLSTADTLLDEADRALYAAKTSGRDRILVPEPEPALEREESQRAQRGTGPRAAGI